MIGAPTWERVGEGFEFRWDMHRISLAHFRESSGDLKAELTAERAEGDAWVLLSGLTVINLLAPRTRSETARFLSTRDDTFPWHDAIESVAVIAVREFRKGGPIIKLSETESRETVSYLLDVLIPEGETSIIFGDGEAGKSMFAMFCAVSVATGYPLPHGYGPSKAGNVLYLDYESDVEEHARRLRKIAAGMNVPVPENVYYRESHRPIAEECAQLAREVAKLDIALIICDSLAPACGGDPSEAAVAVSTMNALRALGATRLAIGHVNKTDRDRVGSNQTTFGSIFWRNATRSMWQLVSDVDSRMNGVAPFALFNRKNNNAQREHRPIGFQYGFGQYEYTLDAYQVAPESTLAEGASYKARIRQLLNSKHMNTKQIADALACTEDTARTTLGRMPELYQVTPGTSGRNAIPAVWGIKGQPIHNISVPQRD